MSWFFRFKVFVNVLVITFSMVNALEEKPIKIVITSYNNSKWCIANLESAVNQNYSNYKIILIDDASTDNQVAILEAYIKENHLENKINFIKNKINLSQMANHYRAVQLCNDDDIVVHLDGDDLLSNSDVLAHVNYLYSTISGPILLRLITSWLKGFDLFQ